MRPRTWFLSLAALFALSLSRPSLAGSPGFAFLEIPVGARAAALGGAFTTLGAGAEAMYANPAAIDPGKGIEVNASHAELMQKLRHDAFSISRHAWGGGLAASVRALYSEPIDERDEFGNLIGSFGAHDLEFAAGYAQKVTDLSLGVTAKVVRERIANLAATTYGMDLGGAWNPGGKGLRLALCAQNLGPAARYTIDEVQGEPVSLPAAVQGGVSYALGTVDRFDVRGAVETRFTRGRPGVGMAGLELAHISGAALRAGVRTNDDVSTFSVGGGYQATGLRLDYAYVPSRLELGETHRFSFTARF